MKLVWDETSKRLYETGVSQGVLYPVASNGGYPLGVPWNGLTALTESPSGAESNKTYADNTTYLNLISAEEFGATIEAYTYPEEFEACDGSKTLVTGAVIGQQKRTGFGLSYKTVLGNDVDYEDYGYKIHLIYGAMAAPSEKAYATVNDSPEAITFSWEVTTTPVQVTNAKPTASLTINSTKTDPAKLAILEGILYGSEGANARLPLPDEILEIVGAGAVEALSIASCVPADDASDVSTGSVITITFNNKIVNESVLVTSSTGEVVLCSKVWDSARKILTVTPTSALTNGVTYLVTLAGVSDVYSQSLANTVYNFTTTA